MSQLTIFKRVAAITFLLTAGAMAQNASSSSSLVADSTLPDAPGAGQSRATYTTTVGSQRPDMAAPLQKFIAPGQDAPPLSVGDKVLMGFRDAASPMSLVGWAVAAGYMQAVNGSPNYGTNAGAFAQRFGATAARASTEGVFTDSVLAPVLHEDPRYYRMGSGHNPLARVTYAVTRTLVTKTDDGRATANFAMMGGNLAGAFLTKAYYPPLNTSNTEVLKTFGGSMGGSALGFAVNEFFGDAMDKLMHKNK